MKRRLILYICLFVSTISVFAQHKLQVTECDTNHELTWYLQYLEGQQTIVEIKSNVKLEFESSMDKDVNVYETYEESGFIFYVLLFPTVFEGKPIRGRELQIKSYGFDTYKQSLSLSAKIPVGLLVLNETKIIADKFFNEEKYSEALKEYEKLFSINPKDEYVKNRINQCNEKISKAEENDGPKLNFVFRGVEKEKKFLVKIFLDNKLIGETNINKGFQFKYTDTKPGEHNLLIVWNQAWSDIIKINTSVQTDFKFEYKKKKTGFGYMYYFELVK